MLYNDHLCILLAACLHTDHSLWSYGMIISGSCDRIKLVEGYAFRSSTTAEGFLGYHKFPPTTQPSNPGAFYPQPLQSLSMLAIFYGRNSMPCAGPPCLACLSRHRFCGIRILCICWEEMQGHGCICVKLWNVMVKQSSRILITFRGYTHIDPPDVSLGAQP